MPFSVEEFQIGQLFSVAEASKNETGGGEGVEVIQNEPFENVALLGGKLLSGQFTRKIYHLASRVPAFVRAIMPKNALELQEDAWNAYPYCKTVLTNPKYMENNFEAMIETCHFADRGDSENLLGLSDEKLKLREIVYIDIANDPIADTDYNEQEDPSKFKSYKTGRGPLLGEWIKSADPVMTCYKVVTIEFKWLGLQNRVETFLMNTERKVFTNFHRKLFCWTDRWFCMKMEDIRKLEEQTQQELNLKRKGPNSKSLPMTSASNQNQNEVQSNDDRNEKRGGKVDKTSEVYEVYRWTIAPTKKELKNYIQSPSLGINARWLDLKMSKKKVFVFANCEDDYSVKIWTLNPEKKELDVKSPPPLFDQIRGCARLPWHSKDEIELEVQFFHHKRPQLSLPHPWQNFEAALRDQSFSDVTLVCNGTELKANSVILSINSPIIKTRLSENKGKVEIDDLDPETLKKLLAYIYTGHLTKEDATDEALIIAIKKYM